MGAVGRPEPWWHLRCRHGARGPPTSGSRRAGLASAVASGTGQSRPGLAAARPAVRDLARQRRRHDGDRQEQGRESWMRPDRGTADRLGGEGVALGWVGRAAAAPVLGPDPEVTGGGAGRPGPAGPGGSRGPEPPGRPAAAGRPGQARGASGGRRPRPAASYRRRPRSRPSPPGVTVVLTLDPAGCTVVTRIG
jgi:hypothetical protein